MAKYAHIQRTEPRPGGDEFEVWFDRKLQLRSPDLPEEGKNRKENVTFADTVDEAVELVAKGYAIRMGRDGIPPSYVSLPKLKFILA